MTEQARQRRKHIEWRHVAAMRVALPFIVMAAVALVFFAKLAFTNLILARGDTFLYFYPYWEAAADALRAGRLPLWNPDLFMGAPFLANSQVGFFYPLNWPVWMLFRTPYAVKASIILHLLIAASGSYVAARKSLGLGRWAAGFTGILFSMSGYLTGQVEHINQFQGLAWLPWFLPLLTAVPMTAAAGHRRSKAAAGVGLLFALQLLAGHAQTTFITGVGLIIWIASGRLANYWGDGDVSEQSIWTRFVPATDLLILVGGAVLGVLVAAAQLLPTLELSRLSSRQGGLPINEALSFSLNPLLLTRSLLPNYQHPLFSEYGAMMPVTVLILAVIGAWQWRKRRGALSSTMLVAAGLFLALGSFNPLNWLLMRVPGFDLFRAPARWMALYTLGISLLAGIGWQVLWDRRPIISVQKTASGKGITGELRVPIIASLTMLGLLMFWGVAAKTAAGIMPIGPEAPFELPRTASALIWLVEIGIFLAVWRISMASSGPLFVDLKTQRNGAAALLGLIGFSVMVLFVTTRAHPYNNLTTPEAYFDLRPSVSRILAEQTCLEEPCSATRGRFLSLSNIFFDPGDTDEIRSIYQDQLTAEALYDYIVAIKQKEIIAPNLSLAMGLPSVDGFDGGILPLRNYSRVMRLLLPEGKTTTDGRLREQLQEVPDDSWLDLFNVRFVITDKVGDLWRDGVFFDRQHPVKLVQGEYTSVGYLPKFESTEIQLLAESHPGAAELLSSSGDRWLVDAEPLGQGLFRYQLPEPAILEGLRIRSCSSGSSGFCLFSGISLVDLRDGAFQSVLLGDYRLVHSGDVKIYENLDALPRAFMVYDWAWFNEAELAVEALGADVVDTAGTGFLVGNGQKAADETDVSASHTSIQSYKPESVDIQVQTDTAGMLVLTDAYYPGWEAYLDGEMVEISLANGMFRSVEVPVGTHQIEFVYQPDIARHGSVVSIFGLLILLVLSIRSAWNSAPGLP